MLLFSYLGPMRPLRSLLIYLAVILLGGALLAPWLYWLAHWASGQSPRLATLGGQPFHRYVNRAMLGLAVAGLWPLLRNISMDSWAAIGLVKPAGQWPRLAAGFGLGFASLAGVALLAILGGARTVSEEFSASVLLSKITSAGLTAAIVSVLEELLFRGAIFGALRKAHRWTTALVLSSGIYSLVHFFQKPVSPADVTWRSGLELLPRMLHGFVEVEMLVPGFFTLFLAGLILGLAYQRSRNLYLSIGLHAGWIFWLKFYGAVTTESAGANRWFWGSDKLIDGWLALAMLLPVLGAIWLWPMRKEPPSNVA